MSSRSLRAVRMPAFGMRWGMTALLATGVAASSVLVPGASAKAHSAVVGQLPATSLVQSVRADVGTLTVGALTWKSTTTPLTPTFIGDSVGGRGSLASTPSATWQARVKAKIATFGPVGVNGTYSVTHDAFGNTTAASISNLAVPSEVTTVGLGTNDMRDGVGYGTFYSNYADLLDRVRGVSPDTTLICLGVWATPSVKQAHFDALINEQCAKHRGIFISLTDLFAYSPNRLPTGQPAFGGYHTDGFHPDDDGQAAIARRVLIALRLQ